MTDLSLGACCICESTENVNSIMTLDRRAPTPGKGWGCVQCGLPNDGAIAVLCDTCAELYVAGRAKLVYVCRGYPADDGRMFFVHLPEDTFDHDKSKHPELLDA